MLASLLHSFSELILPDNAIIQFIVVENNQESSLGQTIQDFREKVPQASVCYEREGRLGIAYARNRALELALAAGANILAFADDDEVVEQDWLVQLLAARDVQDFDFVGSPVRLAPVPPGASSLNKLVWAGMNRIRQRSEEKSIRAMERGQAQTIRLATGSWMANLEFFRRTGLRFDNSLALAGGEDWKLWGDAVSLGARTSWTPYAIAYETIPVERLTLFYHYKRSRDHSSMSMENCHTQRKTPIRFVASILSRLLAFIFFTMTALLTRGQTMVRAASCLGSLVGLLRAFLRRPSFHYRRVYGS